MFKPKIYFKNGYWRVVAVGSAYKYLKEIEKEYLHSAHCFVSNLNK